jgi:LuxR family maltose regulon positive regulatory protein
VLERKLTTDHPRVDKNLILLKRDRINKMLEEACQSQLVSIVANAGYGKTCAVREYLDCKKREAIWFNLTERDNNPSYFWEHYLKAVGEIRPQFASQIAEIGFPESDVQFDLYRSIMFSELSENEHICIVLDNVHVLKSPDMLGFLERCLQQLPPELSWSVISRNDSIFHSAAFIANRHFETINEEDLCFTESEAYEFFRLLGLNITNDYLYSVIESTDGWAFAVNLIGQLLKKTDGNVLIAHEALKANVFELIQRQVELQVSPELLGLLARMSMLQYLPETIVYDLSGGKQSLMDELDSMTAFVRHDTLLHVYNIHALFRIYLTDRQARLSDEERNETWRIAATWYELNGYKSEAIVCYENIGDWSAIINLIHDYPLELPRSQASFFLEVLSRGPQDKLLEIKEYYLLNARLLSCSGRVREAKEFCRSMIREFEQRKRDSFNIYVLKCLNIALGLMELNAAPLTKEFDFDHYFIEAERYLKLGAHPGGGQANNILPIGAFAIRAGSERKGIIEDYINAAKRGEKSLAAANRGCMSGYSNLAEAEYAFYQGRLEDAEQYAFYASHDAESDNQCLIRSYALLMMLNCAAELGDYAKLQSVYREAQEHHESQCGIYRRAMRDTINAQYNMIIGQTEDVASWLSNGFEGAEDIVSQTVEDHVIFMKCKVLIETRKYRDALYCIENDRSIKQFLLGRLNMKIFEAVCLYHLKDSAGAIQALEKAWRIAEPHGLSMAFVLLGRDMHTLCQAALRDKNHHIPKDWLEAMIRRVSIHSKRISGIRASWRREHHVEKPMRLTARETAILNDLGQGLTRLEISENQGISVNTVKTILGAVYIKLGAQNNVDAIRIAKERQLI